MQKRKKIEWQYLRILTVLNEKNLACAENAKKKVKIVNYIPPPSKKRYKKTKNKIKWTSLCDVSKKSRKIIAIGLKF